MNQIKEVTNWIDAAKQVPNTRNRANYIGFVLSEVSEMLKTVANGDFELETLAGRMEHVSKKFRGATFDYVVATMTRAQKANLIDDAFDTAWTAIGLMHMQGDAQKSWEEGAASNYSKFENGMCQLDETGKVIKAPSFFEPNFEPFVR